MKIPANRIREIISELLNSATRHDVEQGVKVYESALMMLEDGNDPYELLLKLNRALSGIEAHGYFTEEEFRLVEELREIEEKCA